MFICTYSARLGEKPTHRRVFSLSTTGDLDGMRAVGALPIRWAEHLLGTCNRGEFIDYRHWNRHGRCCYPHYLDLGVGIGLSEQGWWYGAVGGAGAMK